MGSCESFVVGLKLKEEKKNHCCRSEVATHYL